MKCFKRCSDFDSNLFGLLEKNCFFSLIIIVLIFCSALCLCTVFTLSSVQSNNILIINHKVILTFLIHYHYAMGYQQSSWAPTPWPHNSTEHPKLIYLKISTSFYNLGWIDFKCYEHLLVASIDNRLRRTPIWLDWPKIFWAQFFSQFLSVSFKNSDNDNVLKEQVRDRYGRGIGCLRDYKDF